MRPHIPGTQNYTSKVLSIINAFETTTVKKLFDAVRQHFRTA